MNSSTTLIKLAHISYLSSVHGWGWESAPSVQSTLTDWEQMFSNMQVKMHFLWGRTEITPWRVRFYFTFFLEHLGVKGCKHFYVVILIFSNANKHCLCSQKTASSSLCAKLYLQCSLRQWHQRYWSSFPNICVERDSAAFQQLTCNEIQWDSEALLSLLSDFPCVPCILGAKRDMLLQQWKLEAI